MLDLHLPISKKMVRVSSSFPYEHFADSFSEVVQPLPSDVVYEHSDSDAPDGISWIYNIAACDWSHGMNLLRAF
jgi:hypothetical protein